MRIRDLENLERIGNAKNIKNFAVSYDRHAGMYLTPVGPNFPESYSYSTPIFEMKNDPDWTVKHEYRRISFLHLFLKLSVIILLFKWRFASVKKYDVYKRQEQRAMQNKEAEEVSGKYVRFCLFKYDS